MERLDSTVPLYDRLRALIAAWTAKDLERVLGFMSEDIVWQYAAPGLPPLKGKGKARQLLQRFLSEMHDVEWRIEHHAETDHRLFVEGVDAYRTTDGVAVAVPYVGVLDFQDGLIIGWRDYVDLGVITDQKLGKPWPAHLTALVGTPMSASMRSGT